MSLTGRSKYICELITITVACLTLGLTAVSAPRKGALNPICSTGLTIRSNVNGVDRFAVSDGKVEISGISPQQACVGAIVKIVGSGFGAAQDTSAVTFNGVLGRPIRWSSTSIEIPVPAGARSGPIVVTVQGQPSNSFQFELSCAQQ
jgi:hypothetical protein